MAGCPPDQGSEFSRPLPFSSSEKTETNSDGSATGSEYNNLSWGRDGAVGGRGGLLLSEVERAEEVEGLVRHSFSSLTDMTRIILSHLNHSCLMNFERLRNIDYFTEFYCDQRIKYKIEETRPVNGFDQFSINYAIDWGTKNHNIKKWTQFKP